VRKTGIDLRREPDRSKLPATGQACGPLKRYILIPMRLIFESRSAQGFRVCLPLLLPRRFAAAFGERGFNHFLLLLQQCIV